MMVVRLVVLAVLAYAALLLIRGIAGMSWTKERADKTGDGDGDSTAQDVLVEDPVCHTLVPKHQAIRLRKDDKNYYFCSDECCDKFSESARGEE